MVVAAGIVAAGAVVFAVADIELPYRVFHSPRSGHRLEVRYKVYIPFSPKGTRRGGRASSI